MKFFEEIYNARRMSLVYRICGFKILERRPYMKELVRRLDKVTDRVNNLYAMLNAVVDISKLPPAHGKLRRIQEESLQLLLRVSALCEKHGISYWLDFGTLLGAVRHGRFVPWDDDVDISMMREDYEKVLPLLHEEFAGSDCEVREVYLGAHFQIRVNREENSIGLDIFVADASYLPVNSMKERRALSNRVREAQEAFKHWLKLKKYAIREIAWRKKIEELHKPLIGEKKEDVEPSVLFYGIDYPHPMAQLTLEYKDVFPLKKISFEGLEFCCPNNAEKHLRENYGNYMAFPNQVTYE